LKKEALIIEVVTSILLNYTGAVTFTLVVPHQLTNLSVLLISSISQYLCPTK